MARSRVFLLAVAFAVGLSGATARASEYQLFRWTRARQTCDPMDNPVPDQGTNKVVWAVGDKDLDFNEDGSAKLGHHSKRGSTSLNIMGAMRDQPELEDDVEEFTIRMNNVELVGYGGKPVDTLYYCAVFKIPEIVEERHIVKFSMDVQRGNEKHVHHLLAYWCQKDLTEEELKWEGGCQRPDGRSALPDSIRHCFGEQMMAAWAVGGSDFYPPKDAGFPIGGRNGPRYVGIEFHYDNPGLIPDVYDNSGITMTYTKKLREHRAAMFMTGYMTPQILIPPRQENFDVHAFCPSGCTESIPAEGINVFAAVPHAHLAGRSLTTRHIRGGRQLPHLDDSPFYDFDFQSFISIDPPRKILPGDALELSCFYNTMDRANWTTGGISTRNEMCLSILSYWPATYPQRDPFAGCFSGEHNETHVLTACNNNFGWREKTIIKEPWVPKDPCKDRPQQAAAVAGGVRPEVAGLLPTSFDPDAEFQFQQQLDPQGDFTLYWNLVDDDSAIEFGAKVKSQGWWGFGFSSQSGGMVGSDVAVGYFDRDGLPVLEDRFASAKAVPDLDSQQDFRAVAGRRKHVDDDAKASLSAGEWVLVVLAIVGFLAAVSLIGAKWYKAKREREETHEVEYVLNTGNGDYAGVP